MQAFYCREDELRKLNKRYNDDRFECVIIYGRRRVGKTALINQFCKDKPTVFFSARIRQESKISKRCPVPS